MRVHLEGIGRAVLHGFRESTANEAPHDLSGVTAVPFEFEGFAWAGAGMGLGVFDAFFPQSPSRVQQLATRVAPNRFMIHLGAGWAIAGIQDLRYDEGSFAQNGDESLRWIPLVGYGAHNVYFHWAHYVEDRLIPKGLSTGGRRLFDEGVGLALWLGEGANAERASARVAEFQAERQMDVWTGLGFGCAYAGVAEKTSLHYLREACGPFLPYLAEGAAMAARSRHTAGIPTDYTEMACQRLCGMGCFRAAQLTEEALQSLSRDRTVPSYEAWRRRIRSRL